MIKNRPKISIVTPSFNQGHFIEETIDSVLSQQYPNLEYIIIDGGSTDNSIEIIKKYAKHLHYWVSAKDNGQSHAINKGLSRASGTVFNWLNSDDTYTEGTLKRVGEIFMEPEVNIFAAKSEIFYPDGSRFLSKGTDIYSDNLAKTIGCARIDQPETFFRKSCVDAVGGIQENLHYIMDRDLWIRYLLKYGLAGIHTSDHVAVRFRIHDQSKTSSRGTEFNKERADYYFSMANNGGNDVIARTLNIAENCRSIPAPVVSDKELLKSLLNYHLLLLAEEKYQNNEKYLTHHYLQNVDANILDPSSKKLYHKIRFRNQYLPLVMINLFRRLSRRP